jgi:hypothetical protein
MNCDRVIESIPLYWYGELPAGEEEQIEQHVQGCPACRRELERHKALASALDRRETQLPAGLLAECRHDLMRTVYRSEPATHSGWAGFRESLAALSGLFSRYRQPIGAMALIALGFFSARLTVPRAAGPAAPSSDVVYSAIHSIQPDAAGRIRISLDETRRRVISGNPGDSGIVRLLLAAAKEEENPAVRVESVGMLQSQPASAGVRDVLLSAALHDPSAAVRLKAIEGLRSFAAEPQVRRALAQVLLNDENPGVRIRTVDTMVDHRDDSMVGILQDVVQKESNSYVRQRCARMLQEMNASVGTF